MDAYEAITTRRSTRAFRQIQIESEKLEKLVASGRLAPSGCNSQTNRFFVVQDREVLSRLASFVESAFAKMTIEENAYQSLKNSIAQSKRGGYAFHYNAPTLIVVANKKDYGNNMADVAVAIENMMIEANALDLGSCWINQLKWLNEEPTLLELFRSFGLREDERVYGAAAFGYPESESGLPNRTPLDRKGNEVVYI